MNGRNEDNNNSNIKTVTVLNNEHQMRISGRFIYDWNGRRL